ncbi:MAG: hypothetical protein ACOYL8_02260 [Patescibacteria group bacterium]
MNTTDNTGLGLIKAVIERVQNEKSLFNSALKKLVNSTEEELDDFLKRKITAKVTEGIIRLISGDSTLTIKALDGSRLIYNAKDTFKSGIDGDFVNWGVNNPGVATMEAFVQVHEMIGDGKLMDIFKSLPGTWNQKWLSQNQFIDFCETLPDWLRQEGYGTFSLIKKDENKPINEDNPEDNLVVVGVRVNSDGLDVYVNRLGDADVFDGQFRRRVVSPQLIPSVT